jgi:hypothetical protein
MAKRSKGAISLFILQRTPINPTLLFEISPLSVGDQVDLSLRPEV